MSEVPSSQWTDASRPPNLPAKPARLPSDSESPEPPRKRPRTKAIPRASPHGEPPTATQPSMQPQLHAQNGELLSSFPIQPVARFQGASARIKRPREIAHFSYDDDHNYRDDESSMSYYCAPKIGTSLSEGFDTFRHYEDEENQHLDSLLRALITKEKEGKREDTEADFVTWRGMMTKILTAPYDHFAEFSMLLTRHNNTIYIEEDFPWRTSQRQPPPPNPRRDNNNNYNQPPPPNQALMTYWGYKFESLSLLPLPPPSATPEMLANRTTQPVSNHAQFCSIIRTSFGPHSLILGGEVDGLSGPKPPPLTTNSDNNPPQIPYIELKTSEELPPPTAADPRDRRNNFNSNNRQHALLKFERKMLRFWAQSFLLGVPKVIVGWRSKRGVLTGVQEFETQAIPGMVKRSTAAWDGNACINFATEVLGWLRGVVVGGGKGEERRSGGEAGDGGGIKEGEVLKMKLRKRGGVVELERLGDGGEMGEFGGIVSRKWKEWRDEINGKEGKEEEGKKKRNARGREKGNGEEAAAEGGPGNTQSKSGSNEGSVAED